MDMSKGVAHRAQNPGGQNAHMEHARLGQPVAAPHDLHADHGAAEQPTAALFAPWPSVMVFTAGGDRVFTSTDLMLKITVLPPICE